jgi:hypothetical protein
MVSMLLDSAFQALYYCRYLFLVRAVIGAIAEGRRAKTGRKVAFLRALGKHMVLTFAAVGAFDLVRSH